MTLSPQGTFLVTQAAAQALVSSGCHGSIINISSIVGKVSLSWDEVQPVKWTQKQEPLGAPDSSQTF